MNVFFFFFFSGMSHHSVQNKAILEHEPDTEMPPAVESWACDAPTTTCTSKHPDGDVAVAIHVSQL